MSLRPAGEVIGQARAILQRERARLAPLLGDHELFLIGGSSVDGALTKGDVDLHLRVPPEAFDRTVTVLRGVYRVVHPEIWQASLATFAIEAALPGGVAVTPAGSEHDLRFTRTWQLLAADPDLLSAHNAVKLRCESLGEEYERQKSAFFDMLVEIWPEHPAGGRRGGQADMSA
jgi:GrpB-like predicted nucleotidyltransferase (UPF0157 family)